MDADSPLTYDRLETAVSEILTPTEWSLAETPDGYRITLSGRTITIRAHEGPSGTPSWVLTLLAEGDTVGKFGPYDTTEAVGNQVRTVLKSKTWYTVCCDGSPE